MSGLLDFLKTPEGQGLLSATFGGLAGARRGQPLNSIGRAGLAGLAGYSGAQDRIAQGEEAAMQRQMRDMQMQEVQRKQAEAAAQQQWRAGLPGAMKQAEPTYGAGDEGPTMTPGNPNAINEYLMRPESPFLDDLLKQQLFPKEPESFNLSPGQVRFKGSQQIAALPEKMDPNKPFIQVDGKIVPNTAFQQYEFGKAEKGATRVNQNVTNRIENKASESVAGQVGPILGASLTATEGAQRVIDAANRVVTAVDSGKVITGPLANARVTGLQIGQILGVGGKDDAEVLANTRQAIRGLAEMTLQGRKEMSGQGAITESESKLAEKATSGSINELTAAEVKILANASARAARYQITKHNKKVQNASKLPGMENITPMFEIPAIEDAPASPQPTMRFNPATGKLEQVK